MQKLGNKVLSITAVGCRSISKSSSSINIFVNLT